MTDVAGDIEGTTAALNAITASDLKARLSDEAGTMDAFLLDIRRKEDFDGSHIEGAVNFDLDRWHSREALSLYPKDRQIIVICYTGATARQVADELNELSYDAVVLDKGMYGYDPELVEMLLDEMKGGIEAAIGEFEKGSASTASGSFT